MMRQFIEYLARYQAAIRKFFVSLGAAIAVLVAVWSDGTITGIEWLEVALAFLGAIGVYAVPNSPRPIDNA